MRIVMMLALVMCLAQMFSTPSSPNVFDHAISDETVAFNRPAVSSRAADANVTLHKRSASTTVSDQLRSDDDACDVPFPNGEWTPTQLTYIASPPYRPAYELREITTAATLGVGYRFDSTYGSPRMAQWYTTPTPVPPYTRRNLQALDIAILFDDGTRDRSSEMTLERALWRLLDSVFKHASPLVRQVSVIMPPPKDAVSRRITSAIHGRFHHTSVRIIGPRTLTHAAGSCAASISNVLSQRLGVNVSVVQRFVSRHLSLVTKFLIESNLHRLPESGRFMLYIPDPRIAFRRHAKLTDCFARLDTFFEEREKRDLPSPVGLLGRVPSASKPTAVVAVIHPRFATHTVDLLASCAKHVDKQRVLVCLQQQLWSMRAEPHDVQLYDTSLLRWVSTVQVMKEARPPCAHFSFRSYYAYAAAKHILDEPTLGPDALQELLRPIPSTLFKWTATRTTLSRSWVTASVSRSLHAVPLTLSSVGNSSNSSNSPNASRFRARVEGTAPQRSHARIRRVARTLLQVRSSENVRQASINSTSSNDPKHFVISSQNGTGKDVKETWNKFSSRFTTVEGIAPELPSARAHGTRTSTPTPEMSHSLTRKGPSWTSSTSHTHTLTSPSQDLYPSWNLRAPRPQPPQNIASQVVDLNEASREAGYSEPLIRPVGNYTFDPSGLPVPSRMFVRYRSSRRTTLFHRLTAPPTNDSIYFDFDGVGIQESHRNGTFGALRWFRNRFLDVVITHVDLKAPGFAALLENWQKKLNLTNDDRTDKNRYRDFDELRHNIHALLENAEDIVRQVIVVVNSAAHIPRWFKGPTARMRFVTHADIFLPAWNSSRPHPYLPTFNSVVIESFLHRIPGLSPIFVYSNNDQFVGRRLSLWDLFRPKADSRGHRFLPDDPIFRYRGDRTETIEVEPILYSEPALMLQPEMRCVLRKKHARDKVPRLFCPTQNKLYIVQSMQMAMIMLWQKLRIFPAARYFAHIPAVFDRRVFQMMIKTFAADFDRSRRHRFRDEHNIFIQFLYLHYSLAARSKSSLSQIHRVEGVCGGAAIDVMYSAQCPSRPATDLHTPLQWLGNESEMPPFPGLQLGVQGRPDNISTSELCAAVAQGKLCLDTTHHVTNGLWMNLSTHAPHPSGLPPPYHYLLHNAVANLALPWIPHAPTFAKWGNNGAAMKLWGGITDVPDNMYLFLLVYDARSAKIAKDMIRDARRNRGGIAFICLNDHIVDELHNVQAMSLLVDVATNRTMRANKERELDRLAAKTERWLDENEEAFIRITQTRFFDRWSKIRERNTVLENRVRQLESRNAYLESRLAVLDSNQQQQPATSRRIQPPEKFRRLTSPPHVKSRKRT
jgi:hypothetical protein